MKNNVFVNTYTSTFSNDYPNLFNTNNPPPDQIAHNDPKNKFNPITTTNIRNKNYSENKLDKVFKPNHEIIEKTNFKNNNELLHNNVGENLLSEFVTEYNIHIDSADRKISVYPNPYHFIVHFGSEGNQFVYNSKFEKQKSGTAKGAEIPTASHQYYYAYPQPIIPIAPFKNVKYVRLDNLILPKTLNLEVKDNQYIFATDPKKFLNHNRYLIVKINELTSNHLLSTNNIVKDCSFIIYRDKTLGEGCFSDFSTWITSFGQRIFTNANLGNLSRMTITILNSQGEELHVYDTTNKKIIDMRVLDDKNKNDPLTESLRELADRLNFTMSVTMGVIENEINTNIGFYTT